ncbi:hypothetical protein DFH09DRAFT_1106210 [Mycena vulgaris]|nr:hypothetical protein DFH09DRAFT_1106210 [Mycena vulgaris]
MARNTSIRKASYYRARRAQLRPRAAALGLTVADLLADASAWAVLALPTAQVPGEWGTGVWGESSGGWGPAAWGDPGIGGWGVEQLSGGWGDAAGAVTDKPERPQLRILTDPTSLARVVDVESATADESGLTLKSSGRTGSDSPTSSVSVPDLQSAPNSEDCSVPTWVSTTTTLEHVRAQLRRERRVAYASPTSLVGLALGERLEHRERMEMGWTVIDAVYHEACMSYDISCQFRASTVVTSANDKLNVFLGLRTKAASTNLLRAKWGVYKNSSRSRSQIQQRGERGERELLRNGSSRRAIAARLARQNRFAQRANPLELKPNAQTCITIALEAKGKKTRVHDGMRHGIEAYGACVVGVGGLSPREVHHEERGNHRGDAGARTQDAYGCARRCAQSRGVPLLFARGSSTRRLGMRMASGRRKKPNGKLYVHNLNIGSTIEGSTDRCRVTVQSHTVDMTTGGTPAHHCEDVDTAEALEADDFSYLLRDSGGSWAGNKDGGTDGITLEVPPEEVRGGIYERWDNVDFPMKVWVKNYRDEAVDEMLRTEGRGAAEFHKECGNCKEAEPMFRCSRQTCMGPALYCEKCIARMHRQLPTHMLEKWSGEFFVLMTLDELGVRAPLQLGHAPGKFCPKTTAAHKDFVIIDTLGFRTVKLNFCGCDSTVSHQQQLMRACLWPATSLDPQTCGTFNAMRLFEISAYDFVRSLELLSNTDGLKLVPDRRRAFRAIVRQYRMSEMMKRAGRGHDDKGVNGTKQGELALLCRQCPHPDINLPEGWDRINWAEMDQDESYKYYQFLATDANFKLINRNMSTEERDPVVGDGTGFFCNCADYSEHIRKHVDDEEISSCSGFQAMFLANAKRVKGLRVTGVGGVTCARHNMWRPNGLDDLQAGERGSQLRGYVPVFKERVDVNARAAREVSFEARSLEGHKKGCHSPHSFHLLWGAGCMHGETVEQNWEFLNGAATSTKLMGLGARFAALEGLFAFHNWHRQIAHHLILKRRMAEDIKEGKMHQEAFNVFDAGLSERKPELMAEWKVLVKKWEKEAHVEGEKGSPYEYDEAVTTLKDVRLKLVQEEYVRTGDGDEVECEDTPSTFISMGMEIEETQRQLAVTIQACSAHPSSTQQIDIMKRPFCKLQGTYMPKVRRYLSTSQRAIWDADNREPEATRLFMPSDLPSKVHRQKVCAKGLDGVEARLREAEAGETLNHLRQGLRTRTATTRFKVRNWSGQRALTRGQGILRQINIKIHASKLRYRYARQAILKLKLHGDWEHRLRVLAEDDVRGLNERTLTDEEKSQRECLVAMGQAPEEGGVAGLGDVVSGETHRTLSWIWYESSAKDNNDEKLHEALRVEWSKAYLRSRRWQEDLVMVEEEMRRTIEFGEWAGKVWKLRASARTKRLGTAAPISPEVAEGVRAYAMEQVDRERRTTDKLTREWAPIQARAAEYLRGEDISGRPAIVVEVDNDALRWAEGIANEREEVENDMYQ